MSVKLHINGAVQVVDAAADTPLLWAIRDHLNLSGTKYGCGLAQCGACTVHLKGQPIRACVTPISAVEGLPITTVEGLATPVASSVQDAWNELEVAQCGYCQSGQVMAATALLEQNSSPSDADIDAAMSGNICRCATYSRIRSAIKTAADNLS